MPIWSFVLYTTVGSAIWNSLLAGAGCYLAKILPKDQLIDAINKYSLEMSVIFVGLVVMYIAYYKLAKKNSEG
jgi:membrane protein DedA with SNARE-associated domain